MEDKAVYGKENPKTAMPLVSVIIPVHNAYQYVEKAIRSVLDQSYGSFELILIDDGAFDGSEAICDAMAKTDERIVVLHQKNEGISNARNRGLALARGKYIAFCDHDDQMFPGCLQAAVDAAERECADLVKYTYRKKGIARDGSLLYTEEQSLSDRVFSIAGLIREYRYFNITVRAIWNGLYRTKIIRENQLAFDESIRYGSAMEWRMWYLISITCPASAPWRR